MSGAPSAASLPPPPPVIDIAALPEPMLRTYREAFSRFDGANEGYIARSEIALAFRILSMPVNEKEVATLCKDASIPESGKVDFIQFATMAARQSMSVRSLDGMARCFAVFDPENKGWVSVAEFRRIFEACGEFPVAGAALEDLQALIDTYADPEDSGQVAYRAFIERLLAAKARVEAEEAKEKAGKK